MTEPATPPPDEYDTFRRLAQKLVRVPREEVKEKLDAEKERRAAPPTRTETPA
jgi:hypothetical protein